ILARLQHPNIAHLVDAGVSAAGQPYLILEYVEGEHIDRYCDARRLGVEARVRLFLDVLSAVAHAHASLIVHRDIKPSNVLVSTGGQVKLLDFGIAKLLEGEGAAASPTLTLEAGRMLTPEYAAPEQVSGDAITTATDVYALGVLLYVLLGGRHPAGALVRSPVDLLRAILETEPPRLSTAVAETATAPAADVTTTAAALRGTTSEGLRRQLKGDLDTIVAKALKKDPGQRYASVTALRDDLQRYLDHEPIGARPDTLGYRAARFVRRHRLPVALASLVLVALVCGLAGTAWQAREARRQRDRALAQLARAQGMNEFTTFLLGEAIPYGKQLTVRELLQRSEALVQARFTGDPALMVELLVGIGNVYGLRSEGEDALRTMKRAYEASLRLADPAVRANAACAWAGTIYGDDEPAAQRLIDEALARLPPDPQFDSIAAACHVTRGQIGHMTGNAAMMLEGARQALERMGAHAGAASFLRADALHLLALGHHARGENGRSERAFAQTAEELKRIGAEQTN
ncbi:MAG TPA: serine/threonine-protein kinase, partial [Vicinamibacteria bacterium]|nr:serine/threonine-protein kinase [Vicinamibacteria bacterium]